MLRSTILFQTSTAMKPTSRAKSMPSGGNIPGESALKGPRSIIDRKPCHYPIHTGGKQINARKNKDGHPYDGKIEQPVAHTERVVIFPSVAREIKCRKSKPADLKI